MGNGPLKPGYNVQIGVESECIVGVGWYPAPNDTTTLIPFLKRMERASGRRHRNVVADAGYASEENYAYLESTGQKAYIKPQDYETRKSKRYRENPYIPDNMPYDEETDSYTCPNNRKIAFAYERQKTTDNGYVQSVK